MDYDDYESNRISHLALIQGTVTRLAGNSFLVKGWAVTVAGAFFGFALNSHSTRLAVAALIPILAFWALDAYFLRAERLFRALYDEVRLADNRVTPFYMGATGRTFVGRVRKGETASDNKKAASRFRATTALTVLLLYGGLLVATGIVAATIYRTNHPHRHKTHHPSPHAARTRSATPSKSVSSS